jgi:hypothetical protein
MTDEETGPPLAGLVGSVAGMTGGRDPREWLDAKRAGPPRVADPRAVIAVIAAELAGPEEQRAAWAAAIYDAIEEAGYEVVDRLEDQVSAGGSAG